MVEVRQRVLIDKRSDGCAVCPCEVRGSSASSEALNGRGRPAHSAHKLKVTVADMNGAGDNGGVTGVAAAGCSSCRVTDGCLGLDSTAAAEACGIVIESKWRALRKRRKGPATRAEDEESATAHLACSTAFVMYYRKAETIRGQ
jgi:hypothetical protein